MTHAVFFTGLEKGNPPRHPHWLVEGIADYGAENTGRLAARQDPTGLTLDPGAPDRGRVDYWLGYTAHLALECWQGRQVVVNYAAGLLRMNIAAALRGAAGGATMERWEREWRRRASTGDFARKPAKEFKCE